MCAGLRRFLSVSGLMEVVGLNGRHMESEPIISSTLIDGWKKLLAPMRRYHDHRVEGLDHIPEDGPALLVLHHTLATYDGLMFGMAMYDRIGRLPTALGDDMIFKMPGLKDLAWKSGIRPASPKAGYALLKEGHLLFVSPGGMWESLRPSDEARTVRWENRKGFCRLALRAQVPIILIACPAGDDIYSVRKSRITDAIYKQFKVPVPFVRGRGRTMLPRRVKLTHYVAPPLVPPVHDPSNEDMQIDSLFEQARTTMSELLAR
jgi:1-acyl-sn-glycerol-3-phosphate acyltransferase